MPTLVEILREDFLKHSEENDELSSDLKPPKTPSARDHESPTLLQNASTKGPGLLEGMQGGSGGNLGTATIPTVKPPAPPRGSSQVPGIPRDPLSVSKQSGETSDKALLLAGFPIGASVPGIGIGAFAPVRGSSGEIDVERTGRRAAVLTGLLGSVAGGSMGQNLRSRLLGGAVGAAGGALFGGASGRTVARTLQEEERRKQSFLRRLFMPQVGSKREGVESLPGKEQKKLRKEGFRPARSSNVAGVRFDKKDDTLTVKFRGGGTYRYQGVNKDMWKDLKGAESIGKWLHQNVKKPGLEYEKLSRHLSKESKIDLSDVASLAKRVQKTFPELGESQVMRRVQTLQRLEAGDVIVRKAKGGLPWRHATMVKDPSELSALSVGGQGAKSVDLIDELGKSDYVIVRPPVPSSVRQKAVEAFAEVEGSPYDFKRFVGAAMGAAMPAPMANRLARHLHCSGDICSTAVARSYAQAGHALTDVAEDIVTPADLVNRAQEAIIDASSEAAKQIRPYLGRNAPVHRNVLAVGAPGVAVAAPTMRRD